MTTKVLLADEIGGKIHDVLAGEHFLLGYESEPRLYILSPWISNVEIKGKIPKMGPMSPQIYYQFESIDLAHAILLSKLMFEAKVNLVTKPPNEETYPNPLFVKTVKTLLDFLDEIGCRVFINDQLHSKMLLTRQIAIIGSLNLTKKALYDREEIAVCIDDIENLSILEDYARDVIEESEPYGYSGYSGWKILKKGKVTRGWLWENLGGPPPNNFTENILTNIEFFYLKSIIKSVIEGGDSKWLRNLKAYNGPYTSEDEVMEFLNNVLAREQFPRIECKLKRFDFDYEKFMKMWDAKYGEKKTRHRQKLPST